MLYHKNFFKWKVPQQVRLVGEIGVLACVLSTLTRTPTALDTGRPNSLMLQRKGFEGQELFPLKAMQKINGTFHLKKFL